MLPITATNYIVDFNKSIIINKDAIWEQPFSTENLVVLWLWTASRRFMYDRFIKIHYALHTKKGSILNSSKYFL